MVMPRPKEEVCGRLFAHLTVALDAAERLPRTSLASIVCSIQTSFFAFKLDGSLVALVTAGKNVCNFVA